MKYLLTLYGDETQYEQATPEESEAEIQAYFAYTQAVREAGALLGAEALQPTPTATTVRVRGDERVVSDGPFAETKEQLGGFYLLECRDLDEAIEWAARCPASASGTVEVRPIMEFGPDEAAAGHEADAAAR